ncbi:MAG: hypothetical protein AAFV43_10645 [Planctomycetota bacterium]
MLRICVGLALLSVVHATSAVNIVIDYSYATSGFFNASTSQGQQARTTVEAAAGFLSDLLEDSFVRIETPPDYIATAGSQTTTSTWNWTKFFPNPSTGSTVQIADATIAADEYVVYVGARELGFSGSGMVLGRGGPGGFSSGASFSWFTAAQQAEILQINDEFNDAISNRGQGAGDFGRWGGAVTFDTTTNWNYDHQSGPAGNQSDLYSVALHELVHTLGFGIFSTNSVTEWQMQLTPNQQSFNGAASKALYGGVVPLNDESEHWQEGLQSTVFGGTEMQETLMDPTVTTGTTKGLTSLDAASLIDIGWQITEPTPLPGDYNGDNRVDLADYTVWRDNLGTADPIGSYSQWVTNFGATSGGSLSVPEPAAVFVLLAALVVPLRR